MKRWIFLLLFWACCPFLVYSEDLDVLSITKADFDWSTKETRVKYAKLLLAEVETIFSALPNLSPDQERWLTDERERIDKLKDSKSRSQNLIKFLVSKEYRLEHCKIAFRNMRTILEHMEQSENDKKALHAWVALAWDLLDADTFEGLKWLRDQGEITLPKYSVVLDELIAKLVGRGILRNIVFENVKKLENQK